MRELYEAFKDNELILNLIEYYMSLVTHGYRGINKK